jgi:CDP-diglyceride synthetase
MDENTKSLLQSKTVWGALIAAVSSVAGVAGHVIAPDIQMQLIDVCTTVGTLIGSVIAVYGRIVAKDKIK